MQPMHTSRSLWRVRGILQGHALAGGRPIYWPWGNEWREAVCVSVRMGRGQGWGGGLVQVASDFKLWRGHFMPLGHAVGEYSVLYV